MADLKQDRTAISIGEGLRREKRHIDWRFPDESGLSERTLDCRQLAVKEVLRWKGENELIPVFLTPFDCSTNGLQLRRSEPRLQRGWSLAASCPQEPEGMERLLRDLFDREGYALLFYKAVDMPFSAYYGIHDVIHWSLVTDFDDTHIALLDSAGNSAYFNGHTAMLPKAEFFEAWKRQPATSGAAVVKRGDSAGTKDWPESFAELVRSSLSNMRGQRQHERLSNFIQELGSVSLQVLTGQLERLEFDLHFYRRLRELWLLAALRGAVPLAFLKSAWVEELTYVCKCWSLVLGVLMKWKRQPERDYRDKLAAYLQQTWDNEASFFEALSETAGDLA